MSRKRKRTVWLQCLSVDVSRIARKMFGSPTSCLMALQVFRSGKPLPTGHATVALLGIDEGRRLFEASRRQERRVANEIVNAVHACMLRSHCGYSDGSVNFGFAA